MQAIGPHVISPLQVELPRERRDMSAFEGSAAALGPHRVVHGPAPRRAQGAGNMRVWLPEQTSHELRRDDETANLGPEIASEDDINRVLGEWDKAVHEFEARFQRIPWRKIEHVDSKVRYAFADATLIDTLDARQKLAAFNEPANACILHDESISPLLNRRLADMLDHKNFLLAECGDKILHLFSVSSAECRAKILAAEPSFVNTFRKSNAAQNTRVIEFFQEYPHRLTSAIINLQAMVKQVRSSIVSGDFRRFYEIDDDEKFFEVKLAHQMAFDQATAVYRSLQTLLDPLRADKLGFVQRLLRSQESGIDFGGIIRLTKNAFPLFAASHELSALILEEVQKISDADLKLEDVIEAHRESVISFSRQEDHFHQLLTMIKASTAPKLQESEIQSILNELRANADILQKSCERLEKSLHVIRVLQGSGRLTSGFDGHMAAINTAQHDAEEVVSNVASSARKIDLENIHRIDHTLAYSLGKSYDTFQQVESMRIQLWDKISPELRRTLNAADPDGQAPVTFRRRKKIWAELAEQYHSWIESEPSPELPQLDSYERLGEQASTTGSLQYRV